MHDYVIIAGTPRSSTSCCLAVLHRARLKTQSKTVLEREHNGHAFSEILELAG